MDYREYIESISPDNGLKNKTAERIKTARRIAFFKPVVAAAVLLIVLVGALYFALPEKDVPSKKLVENTSTQTTEKLITTYVPDDTVKSALLTVTVKGSEYIEVRNEQLEIKESDLTEYATITVDNLTDDGEVLLGAKVYKIKNDSRIVIEVDGRYYLFRQIQ